MIKRLEGRYEPGGRTWQKFRAYHTTEAIIGGVNPDLGNPEILLLGRLDEHGRLRYTGRAHSLRPAQRGELVNLLTPYPTAPSGPAHPWPQPLPASLTGQLDRPQPLPYTPVVPAVVTEIDVDTAYEHHRRRHLVRYRRPRLDLAIGTYHRLTAGFDARQHRHPVRGGRFGTPRTPHAESRVVHSLGTGRGAPRSRRRG